MTEFAAWLATWHGLLTVGLTSYPALESRMALTSTLQPALTIEVLAKAPIGKAEPLGVQVGVQAVVWQF